LIALVALVALTAVTAFATGGLPPSPAVLARNEAISSLETRPLGQ
jgi:hypothetical protein